MSLLDRLHRWLPRRAARDRQETVEEGKSPMTGEDSSSEVLIVPNEFFGFDVMLGRSAGDGAMEIVPPTSDEVGAGKHELAECLSDWKATPALALIHPYTVAIGTVCDAVIDNGGFRLLITVRDVLRDLLIAPPHLERTLKAPSAEANLSGITVKCHWNQPYLSFDRKSINAPYSCYLHFDHRGVERARELWRAVSSTFKCRGRPRSEEESRELFGHYRGLLRQCFDLNEESYQELLKSVTDRDQAEV